MIIAKSMRLPVMIAAACTCFAGAPLHAQEFGKSKEPIEVTADGTLEWHRDKQVYVARKNAIAKQGTSELHGQILTAHYTDADKAEGKGGATNITRIDAVGDVVVISNDSRATGDQGFYDVNEGYSELTGRNLTMKTPTDFVTARDKITYHAARRELNAWGDAKAVREDDTITADRLIGRFIQDPQTGGTRMKELEAIGNVVIVTPTDVMYGDRGLYDAGSNTATMTGNVRIERGPNIIEGARGEVDLNTNISRIFGDPDATGEGGDDGRVRGVFYPE